MPSPANSITVAAGGLVVIGNLTSFFGVEDDTLFVGGLSAPIASVDSTTQLTLKFPLSASAITDATAWSITRTGPYWTSAVTVNKQITDLIAKIDGGLPLGYDGAGTLAQRAQYDAQPVGFKFLRVDTDPFLLYVKKSTTAGDWSVGQRIQADQAQSTTDAQSAATTASTAATTATTAAGTATTAAATASTAATTATDAATLANKWATQTGAEVVVGQGYGAKKYAQDAAASAAGIDTTAFLNFQNLIETDVASAATVDLGAVASARVRITGTTAVTSFGTGVKKYRLLRFAAALVLTNGAALALPGGANITTAANDTALAISDASGNWRVVNYQRADGTVLNGYSQAQADSRFTPWAQVVSVAVGSTAAIAATDIGKLFTIAGAMGAALATRTLPAAASVSNGWAVEIKNSGMSILRLSPPGGLTVDGSATLDILPGQEGRIIFDGTNYITRGIAKRVLVSKQTFAPAATVAVALPPGYRRFELHFDNWIQTVTGNGNYRVSTDNGATWLASAFYTESYIYLGSNAGPTSASRTIANAQGIHVVNQTTSSVVGANGTIKIRPGDGTIVNAFDIMSSSYDLAADRLLTWQSAAFFSNTAARATNIQFLAVGGGNVSGTFILEGIV